MFTAISPQTAAATYPLIVPQGEVWEITGSGFVGAEAVAIQVLDVSGSYADYKVSAAAKTLSVDNNSVHIAGPFIGRISKGLTDGTVGVGIHVSHNLRRIGA